jgi:hypothetical protein
MERQIKEMLAPEFLAYWSLFFNFCLFSDNMAMTPSVTHSTWKHENQPGVSYNFQAPLIHTLVAFNLAITWGALNAQILLPHCHPQMDGVRQIPWGFLTPTPRWLQSSRTEHCRHSTIFTANFSKQTSFVHLWHCPNEIRWEHFLAFLSLLRIATTISKVLYFYCSVCIALNKRLE